MKETIEWFKVSEQLPRPMLPLLLRFDDGAVHEGYLAEVVGECARWVCFHPFANGSELVVVAWCAVPEGRVDG